MSDKILKDHEEKKPSGLYSKGEEFEVEDVNLVQKSPPLEQQPNNPQALPQENYYESQYPKPIRKQLTPYQQPQPKKFSRKELKPKIKQWENEETVKKNGLTIMKKSTRYLLILFTFLFFILLTIGIVWSNVNFSKLLDKDFAPKTTVEGAHINITENIDARTQINNTITVNVNNNNTIIFPEEFTEFLEDLSKDGDSDGNESS